MRIGGGGPSDLGPLLAGDAEKEEKATTAMEARSDADTATTTRDGGRNRVFPPRHFCLLSRVCVTLSVRSDGWPGSRRAGARGDGWVELEI
jgi:hypothetical protein